MHYGFFVLRRLLQRASKLAPAQLVLIYFVLSHKIKKPNGSFADPFDFLLFRSASERTMGANRQLNGAPHTFLVTRRRELMSSLSIFCRQTDLLAFHKPPLPNIELAVINTLQHSMLCYNNILYL